MRKYTGILTTKRSIEGAEDGPSISATAPMELAFPKSKHGTVKGAGTAPVARLCNAVTQIVGEDES